MGIDVISLIIFGICILLYLWGKLPNAIVALLGLIGVVAFNVVSFSEGFKGFGNKTVILIGSMMVFGGALLNTGCAQIISEKIIKFSRNNERILVILCMVTSCLISTFLSNVTTFVIMFSILSSISKNNKSFHLMNIMLPVALGSIMGGSLTLIGAATQMSANSMYEEIFGVGTGFKLFSFIIPSSIMCVLFILYVIFWGYPFGKKIWSERKEYNGVNALEDENSESIYNLKKQKVMFIILIVTVLCFFFNEKIVKILPAFDCYFIAVCSAVVCVLTGCIDRKDAIKTINWKVVIWLGATLGMANALNKSGGGDLIANTVINLLGDNVSPILLYIALLALSFCLTQFLTNSATITIVLPITCYLTKNLGYNSYAFALGVTLACEMGIITPLAHNVLGMSLCTGYKFSDYIKYILPFAIFVLIFLLIYVPMVYGLI